MTRMGTLEDGDVQTMIELRRGGDARTIAEMKAEDRYEDHVVKEVRGPSRGYFDVTCEDGIGLGVPKRRGKPEPKPGDAIRIYGQGFGFAFHGIDLNGVEIFWRTPWERLLERVKWLAEYDRRKRETFARSKPKMDAAFNALPDPLKRRIERFRREDPAFRIDSESYEMASCSDAPKIAEALRPEIEAGADPGDAVERFHKLSWEEQKALVPKLSDGHSGNTFGGACRLALALLRGEDC